MTHPSLSYTSSLLLFAMFPLLSTELSAQDSEEGAVWSFLPVDRRYLQLHQNPEEPRTGVRKEIGSSRMRLDVGTDFEIVEFSGSAAGDFQLGLQIFAYALTTSAQGLRLQIDALDGFFGGHITWRHSGQNPALLTRLRILHHSAHFVDGHIDASTGTWVDGKAPVPFTEDFGELLGALEAGLLSGQARFYAAMTYATLIRPTDIGRFAGMVGVDYRTDDSTFRALGHPFLLYTGYQLNLTDLSAVIGTNNVEAGVKFGGWTSNGLRFFLGYHSGLEIFGQYYNIKRSFWELGFALDLL